MTAVKKHTEQQSEVLTLFVQYQEIFIEDKPEWDDDNYIPPEWVRFNTLSEQMANAIPKNISDVTALLIFGLEDMYQNEEWNGYKDAAAMRSATSFLMKLSGIQLNPIYKERLKIK